MGFDANAILSGRYGTRMPRGLYNASLEQGSSHQTCARSDAALQHGRTLERGFPSQQSTYASCRKKDVRHQYATLLTSGKTQQQNTAFKRTTGPANTGGSQGFTPQYC